MGLRTYILNLVRVCQFVLEILWAFFENPTSKMKNPLQIDVVLNGVFEKLQVEDLKKCREVCSLWNSAVLASSSWKRGVKVYFRGELGGGRTVETFLQLIEAGNGAPFSQIFCMQTRTIPQLFWTRCGTWIKILRLHNVKFESKDDFQTVAYNACPSMEQLSLSFVHISESENDQAEELEPSECAELKFGERKNMKYLAVQIMKSVKVLMELLRHYPNLEALHLFDNLDLPKASLSGFFNSLREFRQKFPTKLKLKHISVKSSTDPYPGFFHILKDPGLELETINTSHCFEPEDLCEVLSMHASSLKKLRLIHLKPSQNRTVDPHQIFPLQSAKFRYRVLDALLVLEIGSETFLSMAVLKFTPNLRVLVINGLDDTVIENTPESEMRDVALKMCKQLIANLDFMSLESLRKMVIWLPNVVELELSRLTNDHFHTICENWPGLVALVAHRGTVDDMGITGLDEEDVTRINDNRESSDWRPITVPRANISALKDLRSMYLDGHDDPDVFTEVGHCAAIFGVDLLPKLERLYFHDYILTGNIWKRLESRFPEAYPRLKE